MFLDFLYSEVYLFPSSEAVLYSIKPHSRPFFNNLLYNCIGDEGDNSNDSSWSMECSTIVRVQTLHISSPILAAKSPFFYKVALLLFFFFTR